MRIVFRAFAPMAALICLLAAPVWAGEMQEKVAEMNAAWDAAFNAGEADKIAAMYAEDARVITRDGTVKTGPEEIGALFQAFIDSGFGDHQITPETVDGQDGLIYETGSWKGVAADGTEYGGKVVNIYERQDDGSWKTVLHMWN